MAAFSTAMNTQASPLVEFGIPALALLVAALFVWGVATAARAQTSGGRSRAVFRTALAFLGAAAWLGLTAALARAGLFARVELRPPPVVFLMLGTVAVGVGLGASPLGGQLAVGLSLPALVLAQSFRLPLELVMHRAAQEGVMPAQLTFPFGGSGGYNLDIVTGAGALIVGVLLIFEKAPTWLVVVWNVGGLACLWAIGVIALLTSPLVRAFGDGSVNSWIAYFPYVWLPAGCVAFAIAGHVIVMRKLRATSRARRALASA